MKSDSRQRILVHIKRKGDCSAGELGRALGLTAVTIRYHLDALRRAGLVSTPTARRKPGPGRPEMVFRLTALAEKHMPRAYDSLCFGLLEALQDTLSQETVEGLLKKSASELAKQAAISANLSLASRLPKVRTFLERRGYYPRIEACGQQLAITMGSCPYLELARFMPQLCTFDQALLQTLLGSEVSLQGSIVEGEPACRWRAVPASSV